MGGCCSRDQGRAADRSDMLSNQLGTDPFSERHCCSCMQCGPCSPGQPLECCCACCLTHCVATNTMILAMWGLMLAIFLTIMGVAWIFTVTKEGYEGNKRRGRV